MHRFAIKLEVGEDATTSLPTFGFSTEDMFITDPFLSECGRFTAEPSSYGITNEDATAMVALNKALVDGTEDALNAGALAIQNALGIETGDVAGMYFSGDSARKTIAKLLADYAAHEIAMAAADD